MPLQRVRLTQRDTMPPSQTERKAAQSLSRISISSAQRDSGRAITITRTARKPAPGISRRRVIPQPSEIITTCGCIVLPLPLFSLIGGGGRKWVICDAHGYVGVEKPATVRNKTNAILGLPLDFAPAPTDEPEF